MSLHFVPFDRDAIEITRPYFDTQTDRFCDWTVGATYMWRHYYHEQYTIAHGCLLTKALDVDGQTYFAYPMGNGDKVAALSELETYCDEADIPLQFCTVSAANVRQLAERYGQATPTQTDRDSFDYLYHYQDLATFAGRRYSAQRNHINRFVKLWPEWAYHPLTPADVPAVVGFLHRLAADKAAGEPLSPEEKADIAGSRELLEVMHHHGLTGGFLTAQGQIVAFSVGERQGDTLYVHIEKGDTRYAGVYQMMVREYAAHNGGEGLLYINREDDSGDPGLRQSKLAYRPCRIIEKYLVFPQRGEHR